MLNMMLQMIEREQGVLSNKNTYTGFLSEVSEASAEKKQGKNFWAHHSTTLAQQKCQIVKEKFICRKTVKEEISRQLTWAKQLHSSWARHQEVVCWLQGRRSKRNKFSSGLGTERTIQDMHHAADSRWAFHNFHKVWPRVANNHVMAECKRLQKLTWSMKAIKDNKKCGPGACPTDKKTNAFLWRSVCHGTILMGFLSSYR